MSNEVKELHIAELVPDDKNYNKGTEYGAHLLEKSIGQFGAGRSILLDKNNRIIAGNKATEAFGALGGEDVIVVETDGTKLVAVKRTDIDLDSKEGRELALADNATQKADLEWDIEALQAASEEWDIKPDEWGVEWEEETPKPEKDDLSDELMDYNFRVEITCTSESEQEQIYNELTERGFVCRILTL